MPGSSTARLVGLGLLLTGCQGFDPDVFDERLRAATFDRYADELDLQLAVERPELSAATLAQRFRARAVEATTPWQFYRVLIDLLVELRDPHADLQLSKRRWNVTDLGGLEAVVDAVPCAAADAVRADGAWYLAHRPPVAPADASLAARLVASAGDPAQPLTWWRVRALDGHPVDDRGELALPLRGPLLEPVIADVIGDDGEPRRLELVRNGLRGTDEQGRLVVVPPAWTARQLRPVHPEAGAAGEAPATRPQSGVTVTVPRPARPLLRTGKTLRRANGQRADQQIDAWRLGPVGYLRFGTFRAEGEAEAVAVFRAAVDEVLPRLADCDTLVVDLLDNQGGAWDAACHVASFFVTDDTIPHLGRRRTRTNYGLVVWTVDTLVQRARSDVPQLRASKILVLADQRTSSAAEIVAAILRLRRGAILIGERTMGAETWVQTVAGPDGSTLSFGLPGGMTEGAHFQGRGLSPDVRIELSLHELRQHGPAKALERLRHAIRATGLRAAGLDPDAVLEPLQ